MDPVRLYVQICSFLSWIFMKSVMCLDFHFYESWNNSTHSLLFNASLGPGWSYSLGSGSTAPLFQNGSDSAISLNSSSGLLFLQRNKLCNLPSNHFEISIVSKTNAKEQQSLLSNITIISFKLFIHNEKCVFSPKRKLRFSRNLTNVRIKLYGSCLQRNKAVLDMSKYVPQTQKTALRNIKLVNENFYMDTNNQIISSITTCSNSQDSQFQLYGVMKHYSGSDIPFSVILYITKNRISNLGQFTRNKSHQRSKRQSVSLFSKDIYHTEVSENLPVGTYVTQLTVTVPDGSETGAANFSFLSSENPFSIDSTGTVRTSSPLDREATPEYKLTVAAVAGEYFDLADLRVVVADMNDNTPQFEQHSYEASVSEMAENGTFVLGLVAADADDGNNSFVSYRFADGSDGMGKFGLQTINYADSNSIAKLVLIDYLDREMQDAYALSVIAYDGGMIRLTSTAEIRIRVLDINDNIPVFDRPRYNVSVSEDAAEGSSVLQVSAYDADVGNNGMIKYRLEGRENDLAAFKIDEITGVIRIAQNLDREFQSNYVLNVIAYDGGMPRRSSWAVVEIKIDDVNDNAPAFASSEFSFMVREDITSGTTVAVTKAIDLDEGENAVVVYSIAGGEDADKFLLQTVNGLAFLLLNNFELDYESGEIEFEVILRASSGPLFSDAVIKILVMDVNDNPPVLEDFTIVFNNFDGYFPTNFIGKIMAADPDVSDRGNLTFTFLTGNEAGLLNLDSATGEITLDPRLNSDVPRRGILQMKVTDGLHEVRATCRLNVRHVTREMLDSSVNIRLNISAPEFLSPLYTLFVESLASVLQTDSDNVLIISIRDDTDAQEGGLLVTVAIKEKTELVDRQLADNFKSAASLKGTINSKRTLLSELSSMQILPFVEDLCMEQPCAGSSDICESYLDFDSAAPFISSETMIFRSTYPRQSFRCHCAEGVINSWCLSPCHEKCPEEDGFRCDIVNGSPICSCLANYFKPTGSNNCIPCNCYDVGSLSPQCDLTTGQCPCAEGITGKQCNQCPDKHDEIRMNSNGTYGCRVTDQTCPRSFSHGVWWDSASAGATVVHECPSGAVGDAVRECCSNGHWLEPDLFECTSSAFQGDLQEQSDKTPPETILCTLNAKTLASLLAGATSATEPMFKNDLEIAAKILSQLLDHENSESGLNLTSEQDRNYLPNLMFILSDVLDEKYSSEFKRLHGHEFPTKLITKMERYLSTLQSAADLFRYFATPQPVSIITDNIVFGIDIINKTNFHGKRVPNSGVFDEGTMVEIPQSAVKPVMSMPGPLELFMTKAYVGYVIYKSLGKLLPDPTSRPAMDINGSSVNLNSQVITVTLRDDGADVNGTLDEPIIITFKQQSSQNKTNPKCVYWKAGSEFGGGLIPSLSLADYWSTQECTLMNTYEQGSDTFFKCSCSHFGSFALQMDDLAENKKVGLTECPQETTQTTQSTLPTLTTTGASDDAISTDSHVKNATATKPTTDLTTYLLATTTFSQTVPPGGCVYNKTIFENDTSFDTDPNGCYGSTCFNGVVQSWEKSCFIVESNCPGKIVYVPGECCPECRTTTDQSTSTSLSTLEPGSVCTVRNETYLLDARTNTDPCNKCYCTIKGEVCIKVTCEEGLVCDAMYRPKGECCFICSTGTTLCCGSALLLLLYITTLYLLI